MWPPSLPYCFLAVSRLVALLLIVLPMDFAFSFICFLFPLLSSLLSLVRTSGYPCTASGRVLDVGCGLSTIFDSMREDEWEVLTLQALLALTLLTPLILLSFLSLPPNKTTPTG
jgi:hypothetical protein